MTGFDFDRRMVLRAAAIDVLSRHGITLDDYQVEYIALYLAGASDRGNVLMSAPPPHVRVREHAARFERIDMLDALIAGYRERMPLYTDEPIYLPPDQERDLREIVKDLESLREVEAAKVQSSAARARPRVVRHTTMHTRACPCATAIAACW